MQLLDFFNARINDQQPDLEHSEQLWDRRADEVSRFVVGADDFALQMLGQHLQLDGKRVLEISFGGGRHLLEFLRQGASVCGVEISANMIAHTRRKLDEAGLQCAPGDLVQSSWEALQLQEHGWEAAFDLVFLYMSPALSSTAMLDKALAATRQGLYMALYSHREDSLLSELQAEFDLPQIPVGSQRADDLYDLFNALYQRGFFPELRFEERCKTTPYELDYIFERYASWLWRGDEATPERREQLRQSLQKRVTAGQLTSTSRDIVGHLYVDKTVER